MNFMPSKRSVSVVVSTLLLTVAAVASADKPTLPAPVSSADTAMLNAAQKNGFYAGFDYHYASADWKKVANASGSGKSNSNVFSGLLGFRFNKNVAVEGAFLYFSDVDDVDLYKQSTKGTASSYGFSGSLKLMMPLFQRAQAYAKAGLAYRLMSLDGSAGLLSSVFGLGVEYNLNPNLSFNLGYTYLSGDGTFNDAGFGAVPAYNMITVGVNYNFVM